MDLKELAEKKKELENKIKELVTKFSDDTGLSRISISVGTNVYMNGVGETFMVSVTVDTNIRL